MTLGNDVRLSQHGVSKLVYTRLGLYGLLCRRFSQLQACVVVVVFVSRVLLHFAVALCQLVY